MLFKLYPLSFVQETFKKHKKSRADVVHNPSYAALSY